ncbi:MAG: hypothetical protein DWI00_05545, partial [Planctomycetota bacterium]
MRLRRAFVAIAVVALAGTGVSIWLLQKEPMNLLVITLDTTRADRLGCYGYQGALTAAMDSVASEGVLFDHAYTSAPLTLP